MVDLLQVPGVPLSADRSARGVRAERAAGEREEGPVPGPRGRSLRRREARRGGGARDPAHRARHVVRAPRPGRRLPGPGDDARARRANGVRRDAQRAAAGRMRGIDPAASGASPWPSGAPPSRWGWTRCSPRSTRRPDQARSDADTQLPLASVGAALAEWTAIRAALGSRSASVERTSTGTTERDIHFRGARLNCAGPIDAPPSGGVFEPRKWNRVRWRTREVCARGSLVMARRGARRRGARPHGRVQRRSGPGRRGGAIEAVLADFGPPVVQPTLEDATSASAALATAVAAWEQVLAAVETARRRASRRRRRG